MAEIELHMQKYNVKGLQYEAKPLQVAALGQWGQCIQKSAA